MVGGYASHDALDHPAVGIVTVIGRGKLSTEGNWREDMLFELSQAVDAYDFIRKHVAECDQRLQILMAELPMREAPAAVPRVEDGVKLPSGRRNPSAIKRTCRDSI